MVSAIGSSPASSAVSTTVASTAAIEAQIARDKKELSNCVNCESAKTSQGQADIQTLTNKISIAEARLAEISAANPANQASALTSTTASDSAANSNSVASNAEDKISNQSAATLDFTDSSTGRLVDLFV
jgi:hypothetical protein